MGSRVSCCQKARRNGQPVPTSGGSIVVSGVVDLESHFGDVFLGLEEVLVADFLFT